MDFLLITEKPLLNWYSIRQMFRLITKTKRHISLVRISLESAMLQTSHWKRIGRTIQSTLSIR